MDCGFLISFAGNVTFPKAENITTGGRKGSSRSNAD